MRIIRVGCAAWFLPAIQPHDLESFIHGSILLAGGAAGEPALAHHLAALIALDLAHLGMCRAPQHAAAVIGAELAAAKAQGVIAGAWVWLRAGVAALDHGRGGVVLVTAVRAQRGDAAAGHAVRSKRRSHSGGRVQFGGASANIGAICSWR